MLECIRFQGRKKIINIPQEISNKSHQFGILLLNDTNGTKVQNIEHDYRETERINTEIIQEWASGRGIKPVTWETLTGVLREIKLHTLANEIDAVKLI